MNRVRSRSPATRASLAMVDFGLGAERGVRPADATSQEDGAAAQTNASAVLTRILDIVPTRPTLNPS